MFQYLNCPGVQILTSWTIFGLNLWTPILRGDTDKTCWGHQDILGVSAWWSSGTTKFCMMSRFVIPTYEAPCDFTFSSKRKSYINIICFNLQIVLETLMIYRFNEILYYVSTTWTVKASLYPIWPCGICRCNNNILWNLQVVLRFGFLCSTDSRKYVAHL